MINLRLEEVAVDIMGINIIILITIKRKLSLIYYVASALIS